MTTLKKILQEINDGIFGTNGSEKVCMIMSGDEGYVPVHWVIDIIKSHLSDNNGWTAVEDGLPEESGIYLVTCDDPEFPVKRMRYDKSAGLYGLFYSTYGIYDGEVIAWRPLPDPYRSKEGEQI